MTVMHSNYLQRRACAAMALLCLLATLGVSSARAQALFGGFGGGFEAVPDSPRSEAEATRFLLRAGFGARPGEAAALMQQGYGPWIEAQMAAPISLQRPWVEDTIAGVVQVTPVGGPAVRRVRIERWFRTQLDAPDVLRQKIAYALSQILVVSDADGSPLDGEVQSVAEYNDLLLRHALGSYEDLLMAVTRSPAMGAYLSHLRNSKTDWTYTSGALAPSALSPDENYAREVMQLFSIGLIERNLDFSPVLDGLGEPIQTYDQALIGATARVFTGLAFSCSGPSTIGGVTLNRNCNCSGEACNFSTLLYAQNPPIYVSQGQATGLVHPDRYAPMVCYPRYADTGRSATSQDGYAVLPAPHDRKELLAGITIGPSPVACHANTPANERGACIEYCDGQVDTVVASLAAHPNAAPFMARQLIQRLVTSNPSAGYIRRVAEVFEDNGAGVRGDLGAVVRAVLLDAEAMNDVPGPEFGKLREPLLRLLAVWRAFGAMPGSNGSVGVITPERAYQQRPLGAPSVFNFYEPDFLPPGEMADRGLFAPELQIVNETSVVTAADDLLLRLWAGYSAAGSLQTNFNTPLNAAYLPPAQIDALPNDPAALVDALDQRLMAGTMSEGMRVLLVDLAGGPMAAADLRRKALNLIHLVAISPEFAVQP
jgi:uncharacterized protein (DUF1800 family)